MIEQNKIIKKGESKACAYAWTRIKGKQSSETALISAHGDSAWINGTFPSGSYTLTYYCPHGTNLVDVGLEMFISKLAVPVEKQIAPKLCQDYNLMKYQNRHNKKGETYDLIKKYVESNQVDVITIKNSKNFLDEESDIKLSDLIAQLFANGYKYKKFLCAFCRGGVHFSVLSFITGQPSSHEPFVARKIN